MVNLTLKDLAKLRAESMTEEQRERLDQAADQILFLRMSTPRNNPEQRDYRNSQPRTSRRRHQ